MRASSWSRSTARSSCDGPASRATRAEATRARRPKPGQSQPIAEPESRPSDPVAESRRPVRVRRPGPIAERPLPRGRMGHERPCTPRAELRPATEADLPTILRMITALADYERLAGDVTATEADLRAVALRPAARGRGRDRVGRRRNRWASPSTSRRSPRSSGKPGIYLEDLFVVPGVAGARDRPRAARVGRARRASTATPAAWSGRCSTGTSSRLASTVESGPRPMDGMDRPAPDRRRPSRAGAQRRRASLRSSATVACRSPGRPAPGQSRPAARARTAAPGSAGAEPPGRATLFGRVRRCDVTEQNQVEIKRARRQGTRAFAASSAARSRASLENVARRLVASRRRPPD